MKTFVVRLFVPFEPAQPEAMLCGLVEEVASGRHASFADGPELLAFLAEAVGDRDAELTERSSS